MTLLSVDGVSVSFDGFKAINNLSLQIGEPELRAVIGRTALERRPSWTSSPARPDPTAVRLSGASATSHC